VGLSERRAIKEFQDTLFPEIQKQVKEAAGFDVPLEVDWETLALQGSSHLYLESFPKVYFTPLVKALSEVTRDEMGREALKTGLKKVVIANKTGKYSASGFTFEQGVLTLDHEPCTNVDDITERAEAIQKMLEDAL
jgi:hypothetical protein